MNRSAEREWIRIGNMVSEGSIGSLLIPDSLRERERPVTTFEQPVASLFHNRGTTAGILTERGFRVVRHLLELSPEEWSPLDLRYGLRGRLDNYLNSHLESPQSRLLRAVYGMPQSFPAPINREWEIIVAVESAIDNLPDQIVDVLRLLYGLHDGITRTSDEVGQQLEIPLVRQKVRNAQDRGFRKLRQAELIGYLVLPEESFAREAFGATLVIDLSKLSIDESITNLRLSNETLMRLRLVSPDLNYYDSIRELVMADLTDPRNASLASSSKGEIAGALHKWAVQVHERSRREEIERALEEQRRKERLGPPGNNLISGITLTPEQLIQLDNIPVGELKLNNSARYSLQRRDIRTIGELLRLTREELLDVRNIGVTQAELIINQAIEFLKSQ